MGTGGTGGIVGGVQDSRTAFGWRGGILYAGRSERQRKWRQINAIGRRTRPHGSTCRLALDLLPGTGGVRIRRARALKGIPVSLDRK
jgi:hypothetical protein